MLHTVCGWEFISPKPRPGAKTPCIGMADDGDAVQRQLQREVQSMSASLSAVQKLLSKRQSSEPTTSGAKRPRADPESTATATTDLVVIRDELRRFAQAREWDQFHTPRNLCLALVGEVGELAECFQWKHDSGCETGLDGWEEKKKVHLGEELADVTCYLIRCMPRPLPSNSTNRRSVTSSFASLHVSCVSLRCVQAGR